MRTIAIISLKGGSGKTTVATHLALAGHLRGLNVMLADIDPQHSSKDVLEAREGGGPSYITLNSGPRLLAAQFAAAQAGRDLFIIDTPAGAVEDVGEAIVLADLCVMVVRPTMLDLAGLVRTLQLVKRLGRRTTVVMNQAPVPRETIEAPVVKRMLKGLAYMQAPMAPVVIRARSVYQVSLETGRSAEEMSDPQGAMEIAALWDFVEREIGLTPAEAERA